MGGIYKAKEVVAGEDSYPYGKVDEKRVLLECTNCHRMVKETCGDGYCNDCHVSISWEACVNDTWVANRNMEGLMKAGMPQKEAKKAMKRLYPAADI